MLLSFKVKTRERIFLSCEVMAPACSLTLMYVFSSASVRRGFSIFATSTPNKDKILLLINVTPVITGLKRASMTRRTGAVINDTRSLKCLA